MSALLFNKSPHLGQYCYNLNRLYGINRYGLIEYHRQPIPLNYILGVLYREYSVVVVLYGYKVKLDVAPWSSHCSIVGCATA